MFTILNYIGIFIVTTLLLMWQVFEVIADTLFYTLMMIVERIERYLFVITHINNEEALETYWLNDKLEGDKSDTK